MMKTYVAAIILLLSMGCAETPFQGTSTGNAIKMGLEPDTSGRIATASENGTEFSIDSAMASVSRISFPLSSIVGCDRLGLSAPLGCDASGEGVEIVGDYSADLLTAEFSPNLNDLTLPAIKMESLEAEVQELTLTGQFNYDDTDVDYDVTVPFDSILFFNSDGAKKLKDNQTLSLLLQPASWMSAVPVTQCIENGDLEIIEGGVVLSNDCDNALERIEAAIQESTILKIE